MKEEYNGTSWSSGGNLGTTRRFLAGCGTQSAGLSFGGVTGSIFAVTEEYTGPQSYDKTVSATMSMGGVKSYVLTPIVKGLIKLWKIL